ncbi:hypothetical protein [Micromonospora sp. NPDC051006]|uniref:hypothetical protein n=1 Tax=Micromonospora sp. NPDC051006 TaxID=3364283 RepID=UPI003788698A
MRSAPLAGVKIMLIIALVGCTTTGPRSAPTAPATGGNAPGGTATAPPTAGTAPTAPTLDPTQPAPTRSGAATRVVLFRSGGIAGRGDSITVEPDGRWTAVDRAGSRRTGRLGPADLGGLHGLAADPRLAAEARRSAAPSGCADAFSYRLTVGAIETGYVDCPTDADPPPATRSLVELLLRVTA